MDADRRQQLLGTAAMQDLVRLVEKHDTAAIVKAIGSLRQAVGDLVLVAERATNRPALDPAPAPVLTDHQPQPVFVPPRRERVKSIECKTDMLGRIERLDLVWEQVPDAMGPPQITRAASPTSH